MKTIFASMALAIGLGAALTLPATAQVVHPNETVKPYARVGDWKVTRVTASSGHFNGCRASKRDNKKLLVVERLLDNVPGMSPWQLVVRTRQSGRSGGALVTYDSTAVDSEFMILDGFATRELVPYEVEKFRQSSHLHVIINQGRTRTWSLSGSAAALLKIEECVDRGGRKAPQNAAVQSPKKTKPAAKASTMGTCSGTVFPTYRCKVSQIKPGGKFIRAFRVKDPQGNTPTFTVRMISESRAKVWEKSQGSQLRYLGVWQPTNASGDCMAPLPSNQQKAEARSNLGQDAWDLCVRR